MNNSCKHFKKINDQKGIILLQQLEKIVFDPAFLHGKIEQGEFVKLPDWFSKLKQTSEVNQELQLIKLNAYGKNHFFSNTMSNIVIKMQKRLSLYKGRLDNQ